jgi:hypothetical protein
MNDQITLLYDGDVPAQASSIFLFIKGNNMRKTFLSFSFLVSALFLLSAGRLSAQTLPSLPVDFESGTINYTFTDFNGGAATKIANPQMSGINTSANVVKMVKNADQVWGGSWISLANPIDFSTNKLFKVKVFMPRVGAKMLLKVENASDASINYQIEATGTTANAWEELTFDYSGIDVTKQYQHLVIIFDNGTMGDGSANFTYYFDDIELTTGSAPQLSQMDLPVTFDLATVNYGLIGFGGADASSIVADPLNSSNTVAKVVKSATAETWAGTTISALSGTVATGFSNKIPFTASATKMSVRVLSPDAGIHVRLKVEDYTDGTKSVETEAITTVANTWETLTFDFSAQATGTAALNLSYNYNKASIFFNFGVAGATAGEKAYYFDDIKFGESTVTDTVPKLPLDFESSTIKYNFTNFDGGAASVIANPQATGINTSAHVAKMVKNAGQVWAGSWLGLNAPIDFSTNKMFKVKVFMPRVGAKMLLKVENASDASINYQAEATGTVANAWEELSFDYSGIDATKQYQHLVLIFDNGTAGDGSANFTYYFDDVNLVAAPVAVDTTQMDLPVTFDVSYINYGLVAFEGVSSATIEADPLVPTNKCAKVINSAAGQPWEGTTITAVSGGVQTGLRNKIPFTATATKMSVRVLSPDTGIKVRLKVEDYTNAGVSVETDAYTTKTNVWETLTFDFANQATGTAALNLASSYNKVSIFFDFLNSARTADKTYYFDDVRFNPLTAVESEKVLPKTYSLGQNYPNPFNPSTTISYILPERANVTISIYNQLGQKVETLFSGTKEAGQHSVVWNASNMASGVYFYELRTEKYSSVKKLILMK